MPSHTFRALPQSDLRAMRSGDIASQSEDQEVNTEWCENAWVLFMLLLCSRGTDSLF